MRRTIPVWMAIVLAVVAAVTWAGLDNKAAVFDGIVESTLGGFMFPDQSVQTTAMVDTTCDGQPCDGTYFTNVTAAGGPRLLVRDNVGTLVGPVVAFTPTRGPVVDFRYDDLPVLLAVSSDSLVKAKSLHCESDLFGCRRRVFFEDPGCQGEAYLGGEVTPVEDLVGKPDSVHAVGFGNILYQRQDPISTNVTLESYSETPSNCTDEMSTRDIYPTVLILDLDDWFTPPYHIE